MGSLVCPPQMATQYFADGFCSPLEFFTLVVWVVTFALLVGECQSWDAAEDAVAGVLTPEEVAAINSVPGQDSAIMALRAATWLSGGNSVFFFLTLLTCSMLRNSSVTNFTANIVSVLCHVRT
jgi:hypothetical protein